MRHAVSWVLLLAMTGCSSGYRPANSPRIAYIMQGGNVSYYKDGKEYPAGLFGGGAVDAVQGNPRAVAEAEKGRGLVIAGFVMSFASLGGAVTGAVLVGGEKESSTKRDVGVGVLLGSVALSIAGLVVTLNGVPHYYDAVAIYNDGVPPWSAPYASGPQSLPPQYGPRQAPPVYQPQPTAPPYRPPAPAP
jgi:hypothetical protein